MTRELSVEAVLKVIPLLVEAADDDDEEEMAIILGLVDLAPKFCLFIRIDARQLCAACDASS